ncbi:MAG: SusC/RagA family TonB-linked outer membrane protein [Flavobacteriia bacterium]|nr:SusC/RagA family TonB-linked outer membrane protein [Flavobacteriia bacterium]NCT61362.1 SusC/RagA family TonB-linked outer membrane protein [Flavobacteriia bacterium]OIP46392.1 MAG: hypothetical protein AUK46_09260 [Flavobacteriaceae bacterium CG2_30_31_66]PIV97341.1 MAG: SusC/RagA family TonB-linked outer membrane protein [Flavobacteriaceae bacterium CG17_big_fil_post_rev_8_21_14_2_50_31_13]
MKKNKLLITLILLITSVFIYGQQTISGKVTTSDNEPLPGVNIIIKGTSVGVTSDFDGLYSIKNVASTDILVFSYISYKTIEKKVGNLKILNVVLESDTQLLDDIVIIGYGTSKKSDLTGSVSSISSKDFKRQPLTRVEDALQSRAAGVSVIRNTGAPGGNIKIRIRGSNSINGNNDPLVVIDGVVGGELSSLNPNDIQSIDVLKDASASAIYGSRGANGVVLVTTKKGKSGKPQVNVNYFTSISKVPKKINLLSPTEFATLAGITVQGEGADYQDEYFKTAITNNMQVSASGKEGKLNYFLSGNLVDQEGIIINTGFKRYAIRSNLNTDLTDKLSIGLNIYGSKEEAHNLVLGGARSSSDLRGGILGVLAFNPALPVRDADGNYNLQSSYGSILVNPIAVMNERDGNLVEDRLNATLNMSYDISDKLNFTVLAGAITRNSNDEVYQGIPAGSSIINPNASYSSVSSNNYQLSNILTWTKKFSETTTLKLTGIYELQSSDLKTNRFSANGYVISGLSEAFYLNELAGSVTAGSNLSKSSLESYVGRAELNVNDNLLVTGTFRIDQSSRFRSGNRTGYFPSISTAYNLGNLILKEDSFFTGIKVRAGYGETGNQNVPPYSTFSSANPGNNYWFNGSAINIGLGNASLVDPNLTWETTKQFNAGIDFNLVNGRVNLSVDWFKKNTIDLLLDKTVPQYLGGGIVRTNAGEVQNKGLDVSISASVVDSENFKWDTALTLSTVKNKVVDLDGAEQILLRPLIFGAQANFYSIKEGQPLGNFYGYTYTGPDASGVATYNPELGIIGNGTPTFNWGFNSTLTYKSFDLNFLIRGVHGFDILNATRGAISLAGGDVTVPTSADILNPDSPTSGTNQVISTRYLENGSFIRLSNLSLGYTLPNLNGLNFKVTLSAQNLFTITSYKGYDPEVSSTNAGDDTAPSFDFGALPNPRTFTLGIDINL